MLDEVIKKGCERSAVMMCQRLSGRCGIQVVGWLREVQADG
jgi:hypothetical protein